MPSQVEAILIRMCSRVDAGLVVLLDDGAGLVDGFFRVVAQARIHFGGNAARDNLEDPPAEGDGQALEGEVGHVLVAGMLALLVAGLFSTSSTMG